MCRFGKERDAWRKALEEALATIEQRELPCTSALQPFPLLVMFAVREPQGLRALLPLGGAVPASVDYPDPAQSQRSTVGFFRDESIPVEIITRTPGAAVGIGTMLLLHCDLVYAADNVKFSMPFAQLGLCPGFASSPPFPQMAGYQSTAEKLLLGEAFLAQEAFEMGLVSKVLPLAGLMAFAQGQPPSWWRCLPRRSARPRR